MRADRGCCNLPLTSRQRKHFVWQNILLFFLYKETIRIAHGKILSCRTYIFWTTPACVQKSQSTAGIFHYRRKRYNVCPITPLRISNITHRPDGRSQTGVLRSNWCTVDAFASFPKLPSSGFSGHRGFYNRVWKSCLSKITTFTITFPNTDIIAFKWINWVFGVASVFFVSVLLFLCLTKEFFGCHFV